MEGPTGYRYQKRQDAVERVESSIFLTKQIIEIFRLHRERLSSYSKEFLRTALWKMTEAETEKYATRYCSKAVWESLDWKLPKKRDRIRNFRHDHVFRCELMIPKLLSADEQSLELLLHCPIGCVVTKGEHDTLSSDDKRDRVDGRDRYHRSKIEVIDASTGLRWN